MSKTVSLMSTKEAALYFEQVLPLDGPIAARGKRTPGELALYNQCLPYDEQELALRVISSLLPNAKRRSASVIGDLLATHLAIIAANNEKLTPLDANAVDDAQQSLELFNRVHGTQFSVKELLSDRIKTRAQILEISQRYLNHLGFGRCSTWGRPEADVSDNAAIPKDGHFEAAISGLRLVDADKLTWDEVLEFRKDQASRKALRDLRLFFSENFQGKDKNYIADKLMQLVDRQEEAVKLWKFETLQKSLSVVFSNQSAVVSSAAGLAAAFAGAPLVAAAGAALVFPVANCALEFGRVFIDAARERVDRPTRFLTQLKRLSK